MSTTLFRRPGREQPPEMPGGELSLQEPPALPETLGRDMLTGLMMLPMMLGSGVMMLVFIGRSNPILGMSMFGLMAVMAVVMFVVQMARGNTERRQRMRGERRDYLRYLGQVRTQVRAAAGRQRDSLAWRHPDPAGLWSVAMTGRLWERRAAHGDFAGSRRCGSPATRRPSAA